jgi:hypothetical protein
VTVELASGRVFTGAVDTATNERELWLRFDAPSGAFLRPIEWDRVTKATLGEAELTVDELRARVDELGTEHPLIGQIRQRPGVRFAPPQRETVIPVPEPARIRSLQIEASIGNWDADAEQDGIVVRALPLDGDDQIVAVDGVLEVRLIGVSGKRRPSPSNLARARDTQRPIIGHWTVSLTVDQFGSYGAVVKLPFQAVDPQFDPHIRSLGTVQADLAVAGQDVFHARAELVRLRPFAIRND